MRDLSIKRHSRTTVTIKAQWVIYQKDRLSSLVEELSKLLSSLEHIMPLNALNPTPICDEEVNQLLNDNQLDQSAWKALPPSWMRDSPLPSHAERRK
jgi:hypothetical protein